MKANEFVKKFGWGAAKNILHGMDDASEFTAHMQGDTWDKPTLIDAVGLRRLIESHDLIDLCGGLDVAKNLDPRFLPNWVESVNQAILDVESCHVD